MEQLSQHWQLIEGTRIEIQSYLCREGCSNVAGWSSQAMTTSRVHKKKGVSKILQQCLGQWMLLLVLPGFLALISFFLREIHLCIVLYVLAKLQHWSAKKR